ncbi:MAG TPA: plastocyanin/azurin family copper-binding protein [Stellaceae bacterium]|nr:plastocyanin/azurin family copper-binding protein [Stellaceae bacterium]
MRARLFLSGLGVAAVLGVATAAVAAAGDAGAMVTITDNFRFDPAAVTIRAGEAVLFHNASPFVHTVTDDPKLAGQPADAVLPAGAEVFSSGNLEPGADYRRVLTVPGTYKFFCVPHEGIGMLGEITVLPAP